MQADSGNSPGRAWAPSSEPIEEGSDDLITQQYLLQHLTENGEWHVRVGLVREEVV